MSVKKYYYYSNDPYLTDHDNRMSDRLKHINIVKNNKKCKSTLIGMHCAYSKRNDLICEYLMDNLEVVKNIFKKSKSIISITAREQGEMDRVIEFPVSVIEMDRRILMSVLVKIKLHHIDEFCNFLTDEEATFVNTYFNISW